MITKRQPHSLQSWEPRRWGRLQRPWAGLCLGAVLVLGCRPAPPPGPAPDLTDTNILLVVVDTLGARNTGCLAQPPLSPSPTPVLDRLAEEGLLFRRAYTTAPWTQPAVASLLTSKMPSSHGLTSLFGVLDPEEVSLAERFEEMGYDTAGVISHSLLGAAHGFDQGFGSYDESAVGGHKTVSSSRVTDQALAWLQGRSPKKPFFLMAHYFDPHLVYQHHPDYDRTTDYRGSLTPGMNIRALREGRSDFDLEDLAYLRGLHREEIAFTDAQLGRLLEVLPVVDPNRRTLVIVTADHGEEIMEHGWIGHTRTLYDELLRVPLILWLPGVLKPGEVTAPVSLLDLGPSLLESLPEISTEHGMAADEFGGVSFWPLLEGEGTEREIFAEVAFGLGADAPRSDGEKTAFETALMVGDLKLIHNLLTEKWQLFDRASDRGELRPLPAEDPRFRRLQRRLLRWERQRGHGGKGRRRLLPSVEEKEHLRSLGYLS